MPTKHTYHTTKNETDTPTVLNVTTVNITGKGGSVTFNTTGKGASITKDRGEDIKDMTKRKNWSNHIENDKWTEPSSDGDFFMCLACAGKKLSKKDEVIKVRHTYMSSIWDGHKLTKGHEENIAMKEAAEEDDRSKRKLKSTSIFSYFKKKLGNKKGDSKATNPSAVTVELTSDKQSE